MQNHSGDRNQIIGAGVAIAIGAWGVLAALVGGASMPRTAHAQDAPAQAETPKGTPAVADLKYEVATIKPDKLGNGYWRNTPDGFSTGGMPAANLIRSAYGLVMPEQIVGLPGWASSEPLTIQAKMDADTEAALDKLPPVERWQQRQLMLQWLLADRFALKVHHETKQLPVYLLTIAKAGSKLKQSPNDVGGHAVYSSGKIEAQAISIASFVMNLSNTVGRIIVDKTGLTGSYDFTLEWAPEDADASDPRPSIFTALEEQLGLKLEPARGPVDVIVVDSIKRPSEN